jgi:hypothetical protein
MKTIKKMPKSANLKKSFKWNLAKKKFQTLFDSLFSSLVLSFQISSLDFMTLQIIKIGIRDGIVHVHQDFRNKFNVLNVMNVI